MRVLVEGAASTSVNMSAVEIAGKTFEGSHLASGFGIEFAGALEGPFCAPCSIDVESMPL